MSLKIKTNCQKKSANKARRVEVVKNGNFGKSALTEWTTEGVMDWMVSEMTRSVTVHIAGLRAAQPKINCLGMPLHPFFLFS